MSPVFDEPLRIVIVLLHLYEGDTLENDESEQHDDCGKCHGIDCGAFVRHHSVLRSHMSVLLIVFYFVIPHAVFAWDEPIFTQQVSDTNQRITKTAIARKLCTYWLALDVFKSVGFRDFKYTLHSVAKLILRPLLFVNTCHPETATAATL